MTNSVPDFSDEDRERLHARLDDLLDANPCAVKSMRVSAWDALAKDTDGAVQVVRQQSLRLESADFEPRWPVVQQAQPVKITMTKAVAPRRAGRTHKVAVVLPDPQIGYRLYADTHELDPFHDERAIDVALQILADVRPDLVVFLGHYLDLATFGTFEQEVTFAATTQRALDYGHELLARTRALAPRAEIRLVDGNHDRRLEKMITRNAAAALGLKQASTTGWPVLSVPHLLRLDEMGIEYVGGYPAGETWINERVKCIHGSIVRSGGSTARAVAEAERASVIFGHVHRIETHYKTASTHGGGITRLAHSPGCLCRIDGAVPSANGSTTLEGRPVRKYEPWQQGLAVVSYEDGDAPFHLEQVVINTFDGYTAMYGGKIYTPALARSAQMPLAA